MLLLHSRHPRYRYSACKNYSKRRHFARVSKSEQIETKTVVASAETLPGLLSTTSSDCLTKTKVPVKINRISATGFFDTALQFYPQHPFQSLWNSNNAF